LATQPLDQRIPELRGEVREFQVQYPHLSDDDSFVAWFVRAYLVDNDEQAFSSVSGGAKDKGIDAVVIDDNAHRVFVLQGKYRRKPLDRPKAATMSSGLLT
jgi:hypothetical protein